MRSERHHARVGAGLSTGSARLGAWLLLLASVLSSNGYARTALEARQELANIGVAFERSVFIERTKESDAVAVELFLQAGMNPTAADDAGRTAMVWAAIEDHARILEVFAAAGVELEGAADTDGRTLLHWASRENSLAAARFLIKAGVGLETRDKQGDNALLHAVKRKHEAVVALLVDNGADVNASDVNGLAPIQWATLQGWTEGFELLATAGANLTIRVPRSGTVTDADTGGWYVLEKESSLLTVAAARGNAGIVKALLAKGVRPDGPEAVAALTKAASDGYAEVVALLLGAGAPVNGRDGQSRTALFYAAQNGHAEIVRELLATGANEQLDLALMKAAGAGHGAITRMLLQAGAGAEVALNDWREVVRLARDRGHNHILELLQGPRTELVRDEHQPTARDIRHFQGCLQAFGYDPGTMDGVLGETTVAALRQFQGNTGLPESGRLDASTRDALIEKGCPRIAAVERIR